MIQQKIRKTLMDWAAADYARFSRALIPGLSRPIIGVRLPALRSLAKDLSQRDDALEILRCLPTDYFEDIMLRGIMVGYVPLEWKLRWEEIGNFLSFIDNWSICDSCCATYREVRLHRSEVWADLMNYLQSDQEYVQRFAIVMMLDHFMVDDWLSSVLRAWKKVVPHGFYVEMALGWGLSVAFLHSPQSTLSLLRDPSFSMACRKKACQKILESRRTPQEYRPIIHELKSHIVSYK